MIPGKIFSRTILGVITPPRFLLWKRGMQFTMAALQVVRILFYYNSMTELILHVNFAALIRRVRYPFKAIFNHLLVLQLVRSRQHLG
jgi:hypothetical protein